jgi:hypothetical protein
MRLQRESDHPDFVGWSGMAPIFFTLVYGIGLNAHRKKNVLVWDLDDKLLQAGVVGCENYMFWGRQADFHAHEDQNKLTIEINTQDSFPLEVRYKNHTFSYQIRVLLHLSRS